MAHQFVSDQSDQLKGVWFKPNGRRYCTWLFDNSTSTLMARRGAITRTTRVQTPLSAEELKDALPKMALDLAHDPTATEHITH